MRREPNAVTPVIAVVMMSHSATSAGGRDSTIMPIAPATAALTPESAATAGTSGRSASTMNGTARTKPNREPDVPLDTRTVAGVRIPARTAPAKTIRPATRGAGGRRSHQQATRTPISAPRAESVSSSLPAYRKSNGTKTAATRIP